jgi:anhydro-N-acetylmuramic acid kinase
MAADLYIGLMSGTSLDGVDGILVDFMPSPPAILDSIQNSFSADLKSRLLALCQPGENELVRYARVDRELAEIYASLCLQLIARNDLTANDIVAIGSHGQTLRHLPSMGTSLQAGDPNRLAWLTGITTVADFRRKDMAAGGQGAPFAPAFHQSLFHDSERLRLIVNIGGISNITILPADGLTLKGYDTGPGNILMDTWIQHHQQVNYDTQGHWAKSGQLLPHLLQQLLQHDFFKQAPPKSTGRETFNLQWLQQQLDNAIDEPGIDRAANIQRTLLELTVANIQQACLDARQVFPTQHLIDVVICGGGNLNDFLMQRLQQALPDFNVIRCDALGIASQQLEAMAFAWFAKQRIESRPSPLASVTGAQQDVIGGGVYLPH